MSLCLGVGVDLLEKRRLNGWLQRPGVRRRFSAAEIAFAEASGRPEEALASAFAAKEAFYKAVCTALGDLPELPSWFWLASLQRLPNGRPQMLVEEPLAGKLKAAGVGQIMLSLTHDRERVLAVVLLLPTGLADDAQVEAEELLLHLMPSGYYPLAEAEAVANEPELLELNMSLVASWLPERLLTAHKGSFGHVLVVGGSKNFHGAVQMAAEAALRGGAGLVTLAAPFEIEPLSPEVMRLPLVSFGGYLSEEALPVLQTRLSGKVLALGMGLGREPATCKLALALAQSLQPRVIDADALFALAAEPVPVPGAILTPHNGEMARLLGEAWTDEAVEAGRLQAVQLCAEKYQAVTVLKGYRTLICEPPEQSRAAGCSQRIFVNTTGNPGMATGGSGDVLAGLAAAWLAQGLPDWQAAALAVYLHGLAGDLAAAALSPYALTATDIIRFLPQAYLQLMAAKE